MPQPSRRTIRFTNPAAGFSLRYPEGWVYSADAQVSSFAASLEALGVSETLDPSKGPIFVIRSGRPRDIQAQFGQVASSDDLLGAALARLQEQPEVEVGESELQMFGTLAGVGVEVAWTDRLTEMNVRSYLTAVVTQDVAAITVGACVDEEWGACWPIFEAMLESLRFFAPQEVGETERGAIRLGQVVTETLAPGGIDVWTYESVGDELVSVDLVAVPSTWDPYLELYGPDGDLITADDDSGEGRNPHLGVAWLAVTGTYEIVVTGWAGSGIYQLVMEEVEPAERLAYGDRVRDEIIVEGEWHIWTLEGAARDVVTISMSALDEELDPYLELYGPGGERLEQDDDSGPGFDALIEAFKLPEDGVYRVVARSYGGEVGRYELSLEVE